MQKSYKATEGRESSSWVV